MSTNEIQAQQFITKASEKGIAEIEAAKSALDKAEVIQVKDFAGLMIRDHEEANQKLRSIAEQRGFEVEDDAKLSDKAKKAALQLRTGESFDHAYMNQQVREHEKAVELFQQGTQADDSEVSAFARAILPKLKDHLQQANQIYQSLS